MPEVDPSIRTTPGDQSFDNTSQNTSQHPSLALPPDNATLQASLMGTKPSSTTASNQPGTDAKASLAETATPSGAPRSRASPPVSIVTHGVEPSKAVAVITGPPVWQTQRDGSKSLIRHSTLYDRRSLTKAHDDMVGQMGYWNDPKFTSVGNFDPSVQQYVAKSREATAGSLCSLKDARFAAAAPEGPALPVNLNDAYHGVGINPNEIDLEGWGSMIRAVEDKLEKLKEESSASINSKNPSLQEFVGRKLLSYQLFQRQADERERKEAEEQKKQRDAILEAAPKSERSASPDSVNSRKEEGPSAIMKGLDLKDTRGRRLMPDVEYTAEELDGHAESLSLQMKLFDAESAAAQSLLGEYPELRSVLVGMGDAAREQHQAVVAASQMLKDGDSSVLESIYGFQGPTNEITDENHLQALALFLSDARPEKLGGEGGETPGLKQFDQDMMYDARALAERVQGIQRGKRGDPRYIVTSKGVLKPEEGGEDNGAGAERRPSANEDKGIQAV